MRCEEGDACLIASSSSVERKEGEASIDLLRIYSLNFYYFYVTFTITCKESNIVYINK